MSETDEKSKKSEHENEQEMENTERDARFMRSRGIRYKFDMKEVRK